MIAALQKYALEALASLAIGAVLFSCGVVWGTITEQHKEISRQAKADVTALQHVAGIEHKVAAVTQDAGVHQAAQAVKIRTVTQEVIRYVPQLLPADTDQHFPLSDHFVRIIDASITGDTSGISGLAPGVDDSVSPVKAPGAAIILAQDLGECNEAISRVNEMIALDASKKRIYEGAK